MKTSFKPKARTIRDFFVKEPRFSVPIALLTIALLLFLYFCSGFRSTVAGESLQETSWVAQKEQTEARQDCSVQQTIIIWQESRLLPAD